LQYIQFKLDEIQCHVICWNTQLFSLHWIKSCAQFKFISYPDKVSHYEFHLLHGNSGTTLCNTNNPLLCEIFGFHSNVTKDSGFLYYGILCHSVSGSCCFEGTMCLHLRGSSTPKIIFLLQHVGKPNNEVSLPATSKFLPDQHLM
jgi:hypothetical protein